MLKCFLIFRNVPNQHRISEQIRPYQTAIITTALEIVVPLKKYMYILSTNDSQ